MERMDLSGHEGEIPIPISSTYVGAHGHSIIHDSTNGPPLPPPPPPPPPTLPLSTPTSELYNSSNKKGVVVKYRECLKNHAASIGGNATDGCGEFMPSGEEGSLEALKCSACNCHRNFHRKEIEGESNYDFFHHYKGGRKLGGHAFGYGGGNSLIPRPSSMIMPLGAIQTSESDEMEGGGGGGGGGGGNSLIPRPPMLKKRFRTKFTAEQKEKMLAFAERVGWRLQKQEEGVVQQFCQEIGVKRRVLKVWMHNNKHNLAKKSSSSVQVE